MNQNPSFAEAQNAQARWLANFAVQAPSNPGPSSGADADLARENECLRAQLHEAHEALADTREEAAFLQGSVDSMWSSLADIDQGRERRRKTSHAAPAPYVPTPSPAAPPPYNALAGPSTSHRPDDTRRPDSRHDKRRHDKRRHDERRHEERRRDEHRYDRRDHPDDAPRRHSRDERRPERHNERRRDRSPSRDRRAGLSTASTDAPRAEDNRPQRPLPRRATPASASAAPPKSATLPPPEAVANDTVPVAQRQLGKLAAPPPIGNGPLCPALLYSGDPNTQYAWPRYLLATKHARWAMHTGNQIPLGDIPFACFRVGRVETDPTDKYVVEQLFDAAQRNKHHREYCQALDFVNRAQNTPSRQRMAAQKYAVSNWSTPEWVRAYQSDQEYKAPSRSEINAAYAGDDDEEMPLASDQHYGRGQHDNQGPSTGPEPYSSAAQGTSSLAGAFSRARDQAQALRKDKGKGKSTAYSDGQYTDDSVYAYKELMQLQPEEKGRRLDFYATATAILASPQQYAAFITDDWHITPAPVRTYEAIHLPPPPTVIDETVGWFLAERGITPLIAERFQAFSREWLRGWYHSPKRQKGHIAEIAYEMLRVQDAVPQTAPVAPAPTVAEESREAPTSSRPMMAPYVRHRPSFSEPTVENPELVSKVTSCIRGIYGLPNPGPQTSDHMEVDEEGKMTEGKPTGKDSATAPTTRDGAAQPPASSSDASTLPQAAEPAPALDEAKPQNIPLPPSP
ncbi:hypothetical protein DENSPDRAFT_855478 [Dentipellis sp. KUC8613]|nr:hypothetical protein DENSPDRAFT_855478 [Dentipellis sp. KUC8613]